MSAALYFSFFWHWAHSCFMLLAFLPHIVFLNDLKKKKLPFYLEMGMLLKKKLSIKSWNAIFFLFAPLFLENNCISVAKELSPHCLDQYFLATEMISSPLLCGDLHGCNKWLKNELVNPTPVIKLNTNSSLSSNFWFKAPPKISFDYKAHVTDPLQLEGTSDLLVVRHSLCVYRLEVGGQQMLQEVASLPLQDKPQILSPLSLLQESTRKKVQTHSVVINHQLIRQGSTLECFIHKIPSVSFPNWFLLQM